MKIKRLVNAVLISLIMLGTANLGRTLPTANAQEKINQSQTAKDVKKSGQKIKQLGFKGNWYSLTKQSQNNSTQVIIFGQDGSLDWGIKELPANNTMVTKVTAYHGWYRLSVRYPDNSYVYGFVKKASVKVNGKKHAGIYFVTSNHKTPKQLHAVTLATHDKVTLNPAQATKNFSIK